MKNQVRGLGKGLDSLFSAEDISPNNTENTRSTLRISQIEPNRTQPRQDFDEDGLKSLCDSIKEHGVISPIAVVPKGEDRYMIIAGERRWRASRMAGLEEIPVIILEASDQKVLEIALVENLQRKDLNPVEEALGIKELMDKHSMTQEQVAATLSKGRATIANLLRILSLPPAVIKLLKDGELSLGHAKVLLSVEDDLQAEEFALICKQQGMSVRELERLVKRKKNKKTSQIEFFNTEDLKSFERQISELLGRKTKIVQKGKKGRLEIEYYSVDDLNELCRLIVPDAFD